MSAILNIAVIGLGRMGSIYADTVASQIPGARLYAVADPRLIDDPNFTIDFDVPHAFGNADDLWSLSDLHAVIIATPTSTHCDLVMAAAQAGKAIFSEKPLALSLEDTHAAIAAVEKAGVRLQVGFMRRFDAAYQKAKQMIDEGRVGTPTTFKSIGRDPFCPNPAFADPAHSGGLIIDMGIHDFDLARWLVGSEVTRVTAEGTLMVCENLRAVGDIDNAVINMRYESGAIGNVEVSRNAFYGYDIRTEVLGSEGGVNIGGYQQTPVLLLNREGAHHDIVPYLMTRFGDAYRKQIHHFVTCLQEDKAPSVTGADALAAMQIGLAATYAAQTGEPVTIEAVRNGWKPEVE